MTESKKKLTASDAVKELWSRGELKYKLLGKQHEIYDSFKDTKEKVNVICSSRRLGKSHILCTLATEECVKVPGTIIKYAAPTKAQVDEILSIVMRPILADCPPHLMPEWKEAKKRFEFPNGSQIQIAATEKGHIEALRGGQCSLGIVDEAGFASNLDYIVQNILIPAVATTKGRIILCSTPNYEDPQHPFNVDYLAPREAAGTLKKFTIYDAPMLDEEAIADTIEAYGGVDNPRFRCEFLAEICVDLEKMVFPELNPESEQVIVRAVDKPAFYDAYISMDIGFKDLTGVLFSYYDYLQEAIVVLDELVVNGPELTTDFLADAIKAKEKLHFTDKNLMQITPRRIADNNNPILLNDLHRLHNLNFIATAKDNKFAQVNEVKLRLRQNKIIIHPRCVNLLYQMKSLKWDKHRKAFMRIRGNKQKGYPASHGDLCDSLIYKVRNVLTTKDPYPNGYFSLQGYNVFDPSGGKNVSKPLQTLMNGIMGIGKKKKK